jgi:hypothetical protein
MDFGKLFSGGGLGGLLGGAVNAFVGSAIGGLFNAAGGWALGALKDVGTSLFKESGLSALASGWGQSISTGWASLDLGGFAKSAMNTVTEGAKAVGSGIADLASTAWNNVTNLVTSTHAQKIAESGSVAGASAGDSSYGADALNALNKQNELIQAGGSGTVKASGDVG